MSAPSVYDHLRPTGGDRQDGVFRVVGTDAETVTLLRVGDADGGRVHTGEIVTVDGDALGGFEPAANPDGNRSLGAALLGIARHVYWSSRAFAAQARTNPVAATVSFALVATGAFGDRVVPLSGIELLGLLVLGTLGLAMVGSGRP